MTNLVNKCFTSFLFSFIVLTFDAYNQELPSFSWLKKGNAPFDDRVFSSYTDSSNGNTYITGTFYGTITFGTNSLSSSGDGDVFFVKFDSSGAVLWAKRGGGAGFDIGSGIGIDDFGNCYLGGNFFFVFM